MASPEINRANAQLSTGPRTQEGKQRSSLNALRHGLTGQIVVMPTEDLQAYQRHVASFVDDLRPKGPMESHLVQSLADTAWRLNRVASLEANLLTLAAAREPDPCTDTPGQIPEKGGNLHPERRWLRFFRSRNRPSPPSPNPRMALQCSPPPCLRMTGEGDSLPCPNPQMPQPQRNLTGGHGGLSPSLSGCPSAGEFSRRLASWGSKPHVLLLFLVHRVMRFLLFFAFDIRDAFFHPGWLWGVF